MRTITMSDGVHGDLLSKLRADRRRTDSAIRLIEGNAARDWAGIPTENRRQQEERLPALRVEDSHLEEWIEALEAATTH